MGAAIHLMQIIIIDWKFSPLNTCLINWIKNGDIHLLMCASSYIN
jgi:hypothetical protein